MRIERTKCTQTDWKSVRNGGLARRKSKHMKRVGYSLIGHKAGTVVKKPVTADMVALYS